MRAGILTISAPVLLKALDLPADTIIDAAWMDPPHDGSVFLRVRHESLPIMQVGNCIPQVEAACSDNVGFIKFSPKENSNAR